VREYAPALNSEKFSYARDSYGTTKAVEPQAHTFVEDKRSCKKKIWEIKMFCGIKRGSGSERSGERTPNIRLEQPNDGSEACASITP